MSCSASSDSPLVVSRHHGLLGTVVEIRVWAEGGDREVAKAAVDAVTDEFARLEAVFSVVDPASELERWKRMLDHEPSIALATVLDLARHWWRVSDGAFDPTIDRIRSVWDRAAADGRPPTATPRGAIRDADLGEADLDERVWWNLNAIAKGWITDRAADTAASVDGVEGVTVNAGGDLVHRRSAPLVVGIEDPARPFDNVPPLLRVRVADEALATSGGSRRGWTIAGQWFGHVLDPRTGRPVDGVASASIIAPDAATADVVATVVTVLGPEEGLVFVGGYPGMGCCVVTPDGALFRNDAWRARELSAE